MESLGEDSNPRLENRNVLTYAEARGFGWLNLR